MCQELFDAAEANDTSKVEALLNAQPELISAKDGDQGWTALHHGASANSLEVIDLLLSRGADPNAAALTGETPLHLADECTVERLLKAGADPGLEDSDGMSRFDWAAKERDWVLFDLLASYSGRPSNYHKLKLAMRSQSQVEATYRGEFHIFRVVTLQDETCQALKELPKPPGPISYRIAELQNLYIT